MFWAFARLKVVGTTFPLVDAFGTIPYALFGFCTLIDSCQLWFSGLRAISVGSALAIGHRLHLGFIVCSSLTAMAIPFAFGWKLLTTFRAFSSASFSEWAKT